MAVCIRLRGEGWTAEQVDELNKLIDPDANPPEGLLFHGAYFVDGGIEVTDFWVSREAFDRFAAERIGPAAGQLGLHPGEVHEYRVHETFPR